jgi:membrane associated rhomboid family serine protease
MWFFGCFVGIVLGYLFKPQLDKGVQKVVKMIRDNRSNKNGPTY